MASPFVSSTRRVRSIAWLSALRTLSPTSSFWNGSWPFDGTSIQMPG